MVTLARALGPGMTTLPADHHTIAQKIANSISTFGGEDGPNNQYILILEDRSTGRLLGLSGIYPNIGQQHGFFSYKLTRLVQRSVPLKRRYEVELLTLSNGYTGATEVGTLAVLPELRGTNAGRLLARARYMLIGAFAERFSGQVMAEMRGWQDADGRSPFWEAIGARFFGMSFKEADHLSALEGAGFIADLMPKQPIYTALLPDDARSSIGRAHEISARAMAMLMQEDFRFEGHIDVFDGGPQVHAMRDRIRTIQDSAVLGLEVGTGDQPLLVSNRDLACFRVIEVDGRIDGNSAVLPSGAATALESRLGDSVRVAPGYHRPR